MATLEQTPNATQPAAATPTAGTGYRRPFGLLHDRRLRAEIAALDAERDCQRIAHLLTAYEFPFDTVRALELALFHTYGSRSVSRLLDRTGEFARRGQKRYDDTGLLIGRFVESGLDSPDGRRAIARMNQIHGHYRIPNRDYLFVLWTFIDFPIAWMNDYGYRPFTPHEQRAWFHFWIEVGRRMGLSELPASKAAFDAFVQAYEAEQMVYDDASRRVALATVAIMQAWFPRVLRGLVPPVVASLVRPQLAAATGLSRPPPLLQKSVHAALRLRARVKSVFCLERYPTLLDDTPRRSYPGGYTLEALGPF